MTRMPVLALPASPVGSAAGGLTAPILQASAWGSPVSPSFLSPKLPLPGLGSPSLQESAAPALLSAPGAPLPASAHDAVLSAASHDPASPVSADGPAVRDLAVISRDQPPALGETARQVKALLEALADRWRALGARDVPPIDKVYLIPEALDYPSFYRQAFGLDDPAAAFIGWRDRVLGAADADLLDEFERFADLFPLTPAPSIAEMFRRESYPISAVRFFLEHSFFSGLVEKAQGKGPKSIKAEAWFALTGGAFYMSRARTLVLLPSVLNAPGGFDRSVLAHEASHHLIDHLWPRPSGEPDEHLAVLKEALADYGAASFLGDPVIDRRGQNRDLSVFASLRSGAGPGAAPRTGPADGTAPAYLDGQPLRWLLWEFRGSVGADRADRLAFTALADLASWADLPGAGDPTLLIKAYLEAFSRGLSKTEKAEFDALASAIGARLEDSPGGPLDAVRPALPEHSSLLGQGRWTPENKERLERLIAEHGRGGPRWDPSRPPLATFDWDNTVIRNDIGEAVFFHAIREMRFKFELGDRFWNLIPERYGRGELRSLVASLAGRPLEQARRTPQYRRYRKLFHLAYERIRADGASLNVDYGWLVQLMVGFTVPELERLADEVIALETGRPLGTELVSEGDGDAAPVPVAAGIRINPEMADLIGLLLERGWEVRIVSATAEPVVARFAARLGLPAGRVHGARVRVAGGVLTSRLTQRTWRQGKADVILRKAGRPSKLAGGDSNSDREMLLLSQGEKLVIDLGREPLRSEALARGWLLQPPFLEIRPSSP